MTDSSWRLSHRADPKALPLADRHYNRQKPGTPQFVPPGRCLVLLTVERDAFWVTSWPFARYVKHAWPGAWVCSAFRNEGPGIASEMIRSAVAITRWHFGEPPSLGMVTFIDSTKVIPTKVRGSKVWGWCFFKAGFIDDGMTKGGLVAMRMPPERMPAPMIPIGGQKTLFDYTNGGIVHARSDQAGR
jgi:hypothetical protein